MISLTTYYTDFYSLRKTISDHPILSNPARTRSTLVQVFSGVCDRAYLESLRAQIRTLLPEAVIIGTSTMGEIMDGEVSSLKTALSITVFDSTTLTPIQETRGNASCFEMGRSIAEKSKRANAGVLIVFSNLQKSEAAEMLQGITAADKTIIVAGGCAGTNMETQSGLVISEEGISDCSVVAVALAGERLTARQYWHLCWTPVGKSMTITKAERTRVYTIDNMPAFQVYRKYLGLPNRTSNVLSLIFPVQINRHGVDIMQAPVTVNADDSIEFRSELYEGEKIRFSYGHVGMITDSIDRLIGDIESKPVDAIFVYSCGWRRAFLQDSTEIETKPLQGLAPTVGFFTNGEFFHSGETNQLLTGTMTTLAISESESPASDNPRQKKIDVTETETEAPKAVDNLSLRGSEIIKTLTRLVESTTSELNEKIAELEEVNEKVRFESIHDALSGLYNRNFYEEEFARLNRIDVPAGIIIGDMDGLKLANDTLGHGAGDDMIRITSEILSRFQSRNRSIFRVGGDEFAVIESGGTQESLDAISSDIEEQFRRYNETNHYMPISISTGSAFGAAAVGNMKELVAAADGRMYENKLRRSKAAKEALAKGLIARWQECTIRSAEERNDTKKIAASFAKHLGLTAEMTQAIEKLSEYHDVGEIGIPPTVYRKREPITAKERTAIERHAEIGFRVAQTSSELISIADLVLKHHEWWNGQGYPLGIAGEHIPLECRMLSVVVAYVAMTNDRPYRKAMGKTEALSEMQKLAGSEFDPRIVGSFVRMIEES